MQIPANFQGAAGCIQGHTAGKSRHDGAGSDPTQSWHSSNGWVWKGM